MRPKLDLARVAAVRLTVYEELQRMTGVGSKIKHLARRERLPPDVEESAKVKRPRCRRLDVDHAGRIVRVQPVDAAAGDADIRWDGHGLPVGNDREVRVDVVQQPLRQLAGDAVYRPGE
jgi:hypothetical protein